MPGHECDHAWFQTLVALGVPVFRFYLEPIVRAVNYAIHTLGYESVVMSGLSGVSAS